MPEEVGESIWLRNHPRSEPKKAAFISQQGQNTALVYVEDQGLRLAHRNQWTNRSEPERARASEPPEMEQAPDSESSLSPEPSQSNPRCESNDASVRSHERYHLRDLPRIDYRV